MVAERHILKNIAFGLREHGNRSNQTRALMQEMLLGIWERDQKTMLFVTTTLKRQFSSAAV